MNEGVWRRERKSRGGGGGGDAGRRKDKEGVEREGEVVNLGDASARYIY